MSRPWLTGLGVGLALTLGAQGVPAGKPPAPDLEEWIGGPIRYIARKAEMKSFKELESDGDRALFIQKFWSRRDPSPESLANEYRQLFWERVRQANDSFVDAGVPGWRTDRGKIHILYGAPTEVQEEIHLDTSGGGNPSGAGRGVIRWIYEGRPAGRSDMDPIVVVPFIRDSGGRYRLSYDPILASVFWDPLAIREGRARQFDSLIGTPRRSELSVMLDLGRMQEVPPQEQVLLEQVETIESYRTHPIEARIDRYLHPGENRALVVVTADVSDITPGTHPAVIARFLSETGQTQRMLGESSFRVEEAEGRRLAQARIVLDPGRYELTVMIADPETAGTGLFRGSVLAAGATERFRLSDVILASLLEPLQYASLASHDEPYLLGPYRAVPKLDNRVRAGDSVRLLYEIYGGEPPFRVEYRLEGKDNDGSWVPLGRPSAEERSGSTQAWELPTSERWPAGEYRIRIDVGDRGDRLVSVQVPFEIAAGAGAADHDDP